MIPTAGIPAGANFGARLFSATPGFWFVVVAPGEKVWLTLKPACARHATDKKTIVKIVFIISLFVPPAAFRVLQCLPARVGYLGRLRPKLCAGAKSVIWGVHLI